MPTYSPGSPSPSFLFSLPSPLIGSGGRRGRRRARLESVATELLPSFQSARELRLGLLDPLTELHELRRSTASPATSSSTSDHRDHRGRFFVSGASPSPLAYSATPR